MDVSAAIIGFGEAGHGFAGVVRREVRIRAFDLLPARRAAMAECGVQAAASAREAVTGVPLVLSLVTAGQALAATEQCAPHLAKGALWCDMNSVAPDTKRAAAQLIEAAGGHYVDIAILAPVHPARLAVPLLLAGPAWARTAAAARLAAFGFSDIGVAGDAVGAAAAVKMIRSVMVKGMEALCAEMHMAAAAADVTGAVLASLDRSERQERWGVRVARSLERMEKHGARRAEEMEEAARTLIALGVEPVMTSATAERQRRGASAPGKAGT